MGDKLISNTANQVFDTFEKWEAFIDLYKIKDQITVYLHNKFTNALKNQAKYYYEKGWVLDVNPNLNACWYLKDSKESLKTESLSIWFEKNKLSVWASNNYDIDKLNNELYLNNKFSAIKNIFKVTDISHSSKNYIFELIIPFVIESKSIIDFEDFVWFASKNPFEIISQMNEILDILFSEEITNLFIELERSCRKNN